LDFEPEAGLADNGDLKGDLTSLLEQVGAAAKGAGTVVVLFIDELQYIKEDQFAHWVYDIGAGTIWVFDPEERDLLPMESFLAQLG
jgi:hypothetical protein